MPGAAASPPPSRPDPPAPTPDACSYIYGVRASLPFPSVRDPAKSAHPPPPMLSLSHVRGLVFALLGAFLASHAAAQAPQVIIAFKGPGFAQTGPATLEPAESGYGALVVFPAAIATSTSVVLSGPGVSIPLTRATESGYVAERYFPTESALDAALPDGNYALIVTGSGGTSTSTPVTIPNASSLRPTQFTNYDALQTWNGGPLTVQWQPVVNTSPTDFFQLTIQRADLTTLYQSPSFGQTGSLDGAATSIIVPALNVAPGEKIFLSLTYAHYNVSLANSNQTAVAGGRGFFLRTTITRPLPAKPVINIQPRSQTVVAGSTVALAVGSDAAASYQWRRNGVPISGATGATYVIANVQSTSAGFFTVDALNVSGTATSESVTLTVVPSSSQPGRITNLAIRSPAGSGAQTLIVGLAIGGSGTSGTKPLLVRGVGPALGAFGVPGVLTDPRLEVFSGATRINENDNWAGDAQVSAIGAQVGAFSLGAATSRDAALYSPALSPGSYSIQVTGAAGTSGVALAEIYDASPTASVTAATPRLINVSARTQVGTGGDILIAGFVISGETSKTVLVRAIGPTLSAFGVPGALVDSRLDIFSGSTRIHANDNWGGDATLGAAFLGAGAFPLTNNSRDAALLITLAPGSYTAQVSGVNNTTGVALVEVYELP